MSGHPDKSLVSLDVDSPIWDRFFTIAPLVVVGTRDPDGADDLAPKHMATPLGWDNYFGFICTESHGTYQNIKRDGEFTVSFARPDQVLLASLSASPRCDDKKAIIGLLATFPATQVDESLLQNADLFLECKLERIVDGFGINSLIAGRIIAAHVNPDVLRDPDRDDQEVVYDSPLLAYVSPGRYAKIDRSFSFPFPDGFRRGDE